MKPWPVEVVTDGNVACGTVLWRSQQRLYLTVVVKATFSLTNGGVVVPTAPREIVREDETYDRNPTRSVQMAGELAPYLARCDVTFVGSAHALEGKPIPAASVRLGVFRGTQPLVDKALHIFGDRAGSQTPTPFMRIPIVYERALGGLGVETNPVGVESPNVVSPRDAKSSAGFGPISRFWPARKKLLTGVDRKALDAPIAEVPTTMPWNYWQAAPADQQTEYLRGDEWIVLDGLHPRFSRLQTQLAPARGAACVFVRGGREVPLQFVADMLSIDGDKELCSIVWRGRHEVTGGEASLSSLFVGAGLELPGQPVAWSKLAAQSRRPSAAPSAPATPAGEGTLTLKDTEHADAASRVVAPFAIVTGGPADEPKSGEAAATPWGGDVNRPAPAVSGEVTIAAKSVVAVGESTTSVDLSAGKKAITPFAASSASNAMPSSSAPNTAATPWAANALPSAPKIVPGEATLGLSGGLSEKTPPPRDVSPPPPVLVSPESANPPISAPQTTPVPVATQPSVVQDRSTAVAVQQPAPQPKPVAIAKASAPGASQAPMPTKRSRPVLGDPDTLAAHLLRAGASNDDIDALMGALRPPPPPVDEL